MTSKSRKSPEPSTAPTKRATPAEKPVPAKSTRPSKAPERTAEPTSTSKQQQCLDLLARLDGATLAELIAATDWQPHSVRGFLSGTVRKKLGLMLESSKAEGDLRRYRVVEAGARGR